MSVCLESRDSVKNHKLNTPTKVVNMSNMYIYIYIPLDFLQLPIVWRYRRCFISSIIVSFFKLPLTELQSSIHLFQLSFMQPVMLVWFEGKSSVSSDLQMSHQKKTLSTFHQKSWFFK